MRKLISSAIFIAAMVGVQMVVILSAVLPVPVEASVDHHKTYPIGTMLDAVSLNAGAAALTVYIGPLARATDYTSTTSAVNGPQLQGFKTLLLEHKFDYSSNGGKITTTCTGGQTRSTATSTLTMCEFETTPGTCTLIWSGIAITPSMSADTNYGFPITISPWRAIKCVISMSGSPGASETITLSGDLIVD